MNGQRPLEVPFGFVVTALDAVEFAQIVEAGAHLGAIRAEACLPDCQCLAIQRFRLGVPPLRLAACRTEVWNFAAGLFFGCARSFFHLNGR